jgi:hypothetical protein
MDPLDPETMQRLLEIGCTISKNQKNPFEDDPESDTDSDTETKKDKPIKTKMTTNYEVLPYGDIVPVVTLHVKLPLTKSEVKPECQESSTQYSIVPQ